MSYDSKQQERIEKLTAENARYRQALDFYANEINHMPTQVADPNSVCAEDRGRLARVAMGIGTEDEQGVVAARKQLP